MLRIVKNPVGFSLFLLISILANSGSAQINVPTERYDNSRTGANLSETQLNTSNVNVNSFGKLWSYTVNGSVQAQPLYIKGVAIPGKGTRNVLYVATMNDVVYALDADSNATLWSFDLTTRTPNTTPVPIIDIVGNNGLNVVGNVGIASTPTIDISTSTIYLVARTKENGSYFQRLHALDIATGTEKFGGPTVIQGSVSGTGDASSGGTLTFDPKIHNQRSSLALANGQIFIAWASHEDANPYHGWVMSYSASTLQQTGIFSDSLNGYQGGIWMSGHAPVVDANNNVYYISGNGTWDGTRDFGESFLKFSATSGIPLLDWFTPDNYSSLNGGDVDLGASGPLLIPGTDLLIGGGKQSIFYLMHTGQLGHEQSGNGQIVQLLSNNGGEIKGGPVYWNRSGGSGPWLYVWANGGDYLKAYHFNGTKFDTSVISQSTIPSPGGASGGVLALSANGSNAGSGIVWSSMPYADDGDHGVHAGVLRALNADDLTKELWNSRINAARDDVGNWPKFSPPLVVNGHVYMASFPSDGVSNTAVSVFGLLNPTFALSASPASSGVNPGGSTTYTVNATPVSGFSGSVNLSVSSLPSGATASFSSSTITVPGSATLTIKTAAATPIGNYPLTISGSSGSLSSSTSVTLVVTSITPGSGAISIDFVGRGTPMAASETAGAIAKTNWNSATGASSSAALALSDETGTKTSASATWSSTAPWSLPIADAPGDVRMMEGYLDPVGSSASVTVAGLPANSGGYDIYVYADGDNGSASRTGSYQISGTGITTATVTLTDAANTNFSGSYAQANNSNGNYLKFSINATGFTITATPGTASDGTARAPINGLQIIPKASPTGAPAFSPAGGAFSWPQQVSLTDATAGAVIYYTTDGSAPTTASPRYSGPIAVTGSMTIRAIATAGGSSSGASSATYAINPVGSIAQTAWTLKYVDSQETSGENGAATNAFDNKTSTFWHTQWSAANPPPPHEIQINLGRSYSLGGFTYLPRQDGCSHGLIKQYEFYVSQDGVNWGSPVASGQFDYGASYVYNCPGGSVVAARVIPFNAVTASYVWLRALSEFGGNAWTSVAELGVLQQSAIAQSGWTLKYADSQDASGPAANAFDNNKTTIWHTQFSGANPPPPHEIQVNLGGTFSLTGFSYLPRQDGCSNGTVKQFEFYVSSDGVNWGAPVASGAFNYGSATFGCGGATVIPAQQIDFNSTSGQYIRFRALSEVQGNPWTSAAEINVLH